MVVLPQNKSHIVCMKCVVFYLDSFKNKQWILRTDLCFKRVLNNGFSVSQVELGNAIPTLNTTVPTIINQTHANIPYMRGMGQ